MIATAFDRSALCAEIRSCDPADTRLNSRHHWCAWPDDESDARNQFMMQSISCAKCGNYIAVSSFTLYDALMESARHIICEDVEHALITTETIFAERGGRRPVFDSDILLLLDRTDSDSDADADSDSDAEEPHPATPTFELVNSLLDNWSTTCDLISGLLERLDALKDEEKEDEDEEEDEEDEDIEGEDWRLLPLDNVDCDKERQYALNKMQAQYNARCLWEERRWEENRLNDWSEEPFYDWDQDDFI